MRDVFIRAEFGDWQRAARVLLAERVGPDEVVWRESALDEQPILPASPASPPGTESAPSHKVPRRFVETAQRVAGHSDPGRWAMLYRLLWRLVFEDRTLLETRSDPEVQRFFRMEQDLQQVARPEGTAPAASMTSLLTGVEEPRSAQPFVPRDGGLDDLRAAAPACTGCDLYRTATQVVFGRGPSTARLMLVGEQPGDQEDIQGLPFVGPAGEVLDRALPEAAISREDVYVTNVVKHFKWEPRGKRRIHLTPRQSEIQACRPWLEAEMRVLRPAIIVCLGSTAAQALMGPQFRIMKSRGQIFPSSWAPGGMMATLHPSAVLRASEPAIADAYYRMLVDDLRKAATEGTLY